LSASATKEKILKIYRPSEFSLGTVNFDDPGNRCTLDFKSALSY